jgi:hypothetical protein
MMVEKETPEVPEGSNEMSELAKAIAEAVTPEDMDANDDEETKSNYITKHKEINRQKIEKILDSQVVPV